MSGAEYLLDGRGTSHSLGAWVAGLAFGHEGKTCIFGTTDGFLHRALLAAPQEPWAHHEAHQGAVRSLCSEANVGRFFGVHERLVRRQCLGGCFGELGDCWL